MQEVAAKLQAEAAGKQAKASAAKVMAKTTSAKPKEAAKKVVKEI